jgi:hypothetical protein
MARDMENGRRWEHVYSVFDLRLAVVLSRGDRAFGLVRLAERPDGWEPVAPVFTIGDGISREPVVYPIDHAPTFDVERVLDMSAPDPEF